MIVNTETARYVVRVAEAIESGQRFPDASNICPECETALTRYETEDHIVMEMGDMLIVVVACEDYWCINPALVNMPKEGWMSPTALMGESDDEEGEAADRAAYPDPEPFPITDNVINAMNRQERA